MPGDYQRALVIVRDAPYQREDEHLSRTRPGPGVLGKGQTVWAKKSAKPRKFSISVYVDGIGVVLLDPYCLVPAEKYRPVK